MPPRNGSAADLSARARERVKIRGKVWPRLSERRRVDNANSLTGPGPIAHSEEMRWVIEGRRVVGVLGRALVGMSLAAGIAASAQSTMKSVGESKPESSTTCWIFRYRGRGILMVTLDSRMAGLEAWPQVVQWEQIWPEALIALLTHSDHTPIGVSLECDGSV